jgi:hypothetical protein
MKVKDGGFSRKSRDARQKTTQREKFEDERIAGNHPRRKLKKKERGGIF